MARRPTRGSERLGGELGSALRLHISFCDEDCYSVRGLNHRQIQPSVWSRYLALVVRRSTLQSLVPLRRERGMMADHGARNLGTRGVVEKI